jgi:hypothetical protein
VSELPTTAVEPSAVSVTPAICASAGMSPNPLTRVGAENGAAAAELAGTSASAMSAAHRLGRFRKLLKKCTRSFRVT